MTRLTLLFAGFCLPAACVSLIHAGGTTAYPETCAGIQSAWRAAVAGDVVELTAGRLYSCGTTTLALPQHPGAGYVVVRTSNYRHLPDGHTRLCPPGSTAATGVITHPCTPNIASSGGAPNSSGGDLAILQWDANFTYGIATEAGASRWHLIGLELRGTSNNPPISWSTLLSLNMGVLQSTTSVNSRARNIVVDRCWLHGYFGVNGPTRGIWADGSGIVIVNNVIEEIKQYSQDAQCITQASGPGPVTVRNNFLAGGGENSMSGGGSSTWRGAVPGFYRFTGNYSTRDQRWWIVQKTTAPPAQSCTTGRWWQNTSAGTCYQCQAGAWAMAACASMPSPGVYQVLKNLYEHKAMKAALVEGNLFDAAWDSSGQHHAVLLYNAAVTQNLYQYGATDMRFRHNIVSRAAGAIAVASPGTLNNGLPLRGLTIEQNLLDAVVNAERFNGATSELALFFSAVTAPAGLVVRHNTFVNSANPNGGFMVYGVTRAAGAAGLCPYCLVLDNIVHWGASAQSPVTGDSQPQMHTFFGSPTVNLHAWDYGRAAGNVWVRDGAAIAGSAVANATTGACCSGNYYAPGAMSTVLVNPVAGGDYRVSAGGTGCGGASCRGKATDASDPGADLNTLAALTAHAGDGQPAPYLRFQVASWVGSANGGTLFYHAPAAPGSPAGACTLQLSRNETMGPLEGATVETAAGAVRRAVVDGLQPGALYYYALQCGQATRRGTLRTRPR